MIDLLGPPPPQLLARGEYTSKFFSSEGVFLHPELHGGKVTLEQLEGTIEDSAEREMFLRLMRKMLQWDPEGRSSARELVNDPWIQSYVKNPWH